MGLAIELVFPEQVVKKGGHPHAWPLQQAAGSLSTAPQWRLWTGQWCEATQIFQNRKSSDFLLKLLSTVIFIIFFKIVIKMYTS